MNRIMIRFFDFLLSLVGLILLSPLFLIIAIWIIADSRGGPLYTQLRVGRGGRDFKLLKFRTMRSEADQHGSLTVGARDHRITRAGYYLRQYKLDELPQLLNVLRGEMSLVGPRPELRRYTDLYDAAQQIVLSVKPGITDYASIEYIHENEILGKAADWEKSYITEVMPAKIELNRRYIEDRRPGTYFKIIWLTIRKIIG